MLADRLPIPGYEGIYEITLAGQVFSLEREIIYVNGTRSAIKASERKASLAVNGYLTIRLSKNNVSKTFRLHRLVAEVFIPNPLRLPIVNHLDGDKTNCHRDNLEWASAQDNSDHAVRTGLIDFRGEKNPSAKLTESAVRQALSRVHSKELIQDVASDLGVHRNTLAKRLKPYRNEAIYG